MCQDFLLKKIQLLLLLFVVVSHIQRIGCQPEKKVVYTVANPARGLLNRGKKRKKEKSGSVPPPPRPPGCLFGETKTKNHATHLHV